MEDFEGDTIDVSTRQLRGCTKMMTSHQVLLLISHLYADLILHFDLDF